MSRGFLIGFSKCPGVKLLCPGGILRFALLWGGVFLSSGIAQSRFHKCTSLASTLRMRGSRVKPHVSFSLYITFHSLHNLSLST